VRLDSDEELLAQLVIPESATPVGKPGKGNRPANAAGFVRVPMVWKERLANAKSAAAIKLALELLFESWRTGELTLVLSNALARRAGVTRQTKPRGLRELERLGLIKVKRQGRRAPRVTLAC
jgi:hypothetical protein